MKEFRGSWKLQEPLGSILVAAKRYTRIACWWVLGAKCGWKTKLGHEWWNWGIGNTI